MSECMSMLARSQVRVCTSKLMEVQVHARVYALSLEYACEEDA